MDNFKVLGERLHENTKKAEKARKTLNDLNGEFRNLDRKVNATRPELMKLQFEKDQYTT